MPLEHEPRYRRIPFQIPSTPEADADDRHRAHPHAGGFPPRPAKLRACSAALSVVLGGQTQVSLDQKTVAADEASLAAVLEQLARSGRPARSRAGRRRLLARSWEPRRKAARDRPPAAPAQHHTSVAPPAPPGRARAGGSGTSGGTRVGATPATPEQLAADQAGINAASVQLAQARQAVQQAQLLSPIAGTAGIVNLSVGQDVSGSSPGTQVLVVGVVAVGSLPTTAAGSPATPSYPVTVAFGTPTGLFTGADSEVLIVLAEARRTLTVPSSAVRIVGGFHLVPVVGKGKATSARVGIGAVGPDLTQITSGLAAGQRVVLANLHEALPTSNPAGGRGLGLGGGGGEGIAGRGTGTGAR